MRGPLDFATIAMATNYELRRIVDGGAAEEMRNATFQACRNYVVKLECVKDDKVVGYFSGFMYHDDEPLILTSGRIDCFGGATKYFALFYEGTSLHRRVELQALKMGWPLGEQRTSCGTTYNAHKPDLALFQCDYIPAHGPRPFAAAQPHVGSTVFIIGFKGKEEPQLSLCEGHVSYAGLSNLLVTADYDDGYSGSPVFNANGFLIGMVSAGDGDTCAPTRTEERCTNKNVVVVPALFIHNCLCAPQPERSYPGFRG